MKSNRLKSLDEFSDESELFEERFEQLPAGKEGELQRAQLIAEITRWMRECAGQGRFVPTASAERRAFQSLLERWNSRLREQGHYVEDIDFLADFDPGAGVVLTGDCPYPGLDPYTEDRRPRFFGREAQVSACVAHLEQKGNRILLIIGASGAGKSSLALAGVLPQLAERHGESWLFSPRFTPGAYPLAELSVAVAQAIGQPEQASAVEHALSTNPSGALSQIAALCQHRPLMLFIDQFEELLTMCPDANEQSVFAQVICALSEPTVLSSGFACRTLLTLRQDHLGRFESNNALTQLYVRLAVKVNQRHLFPIGFNDIKRAIKGPADDVGLRFVPATLIDQLASQTAGLSNGLPLLQFALRRLWDTRPRSETGEPLDLITTEMVQRLPDVKGALSAVANSIFCTFSDLQQRVCERLLLELVLLDESFEEPLRRRRNEVELTQVLEGRFQHSGDVATVIERFVSAGLLRRFGEGPNSRLEVAHEALLRHWDRISSLLNSAVVKERLHLVKQITREAADWREHGESIDYLSLRGERLSRAIASAAEGWLAEAELTPYVDACREQEEAQKRRDKLATEAKRRAEAAEQAREEAEFQTKRAQLRIWRMAAIVVLVLAAAIAWAFSREQRKSSAQELAMAADAAQTSQGSLLFSIEAAKSVGVDGPPEIVRALRSSIRANHVSDVIPGYSGTEIHAVAYAPDGSMLALGDSLGGITLLDVANRQRHKVRFAHVDDVTAIAFSPDGRRMATGSADGKVVIWDTERAAPLHVLSGHVNQVNALAFSRPDGRLLATGGADAALQIWNVSSGTPAGPALYGNIGGVKRVAFGRDEHQLATAGDDGQVIVWDVLDGRVLYSLQPSEPPHDIDLSTDGSLLAIATGTNLEIWDAATRSRRWSLVGHINSVSRVNFSRDARLIATAGFDSTVRVWRLPSVSSAAVLPDVWIPGPARAASLETWKRDDRDPYREPQQLMQIRTEPRVGDIRALAFSPGGETVAAAFKDGSATIWNVAAGGELLTLTGHETKVQAVEFSPDGNTIAAAGGDNGRVLEWDLSGRLLKDIRDNRPVRAIAFSQAGAFAIGSGNDVRVNPGATDEMRLPGDAEINDLAFSPDGSRLVSGRSDGTAIVWELPSRKRTVLRGHTGQVTTVAYSPDGQFIATGDSAKRIILWDAKTLERRHELEVRHELEAHELEAPEDGFLDLAFTSDSKRLVSGGKDKKVRLWDVGTGKQEAFLGLTFLGLHSNVVSTVAIYGDRLATGADDGIRLWDLPSRTPLPEFPPRNEGAQRLAFSPDGRYLAAGGNDGVVRIYAMKSKDLVEEANKSVHRGWTDRECLWLLKHERWGLSDLLERTTFGLFGRKKCPRTPFSIRDDAYHSFKEFDFKGGEQLLQEARTGGTSDAKAIDDEVNSRIGAFFLWLASDLIQNPQHWKEELKGKDPRRAAEKFLFDASQRLKGHAFDPESRWRELNAYQAVKRARTLALQGELKESADSFREARNAGWEMSSEPEDAAAELIAVNELSRTWKLLQPERSPRSERLPGEVVLSDEVVRERTQGSEWALTLFPAYGPGHRVLAAIYAWQDDYASAKKQYLQADAKEKSAEPLAELALLAAQEYEMGKGVTYARDAVIYAKRALARDAALDQAWWALALAEHYLGHEEKAAKTFDQVPPSSTPSDLFAKAMDRAAAIYFDNLGDDQAAHKRYSLAANFAPLNRVVLSDYAEFLLASGRDSQAKLVAAKARDIPAAEAFQHAEGFQQVALSFVIFAADFFSGDHVGALAELDQIDRFARATTEQNKEVIAKGEQPGNWVYKGIRRSLARRSIACSTARRHALGQVLMFAETNGRRGDLRVMRQLLESEPTTR
jgi:WD40 repeat protein